MKKRATKAAKPKRRFPRIPLGLRVELVNCPGASNHGRWSATLRTTDWNGPEILHATRDRSIDAALGVLVEAGAIDAVLNGPKAARIGTGAAA